MKKTIFFAALCILSVSIASAQTADMPNMPKAGALPKGPCDAEMKAVMKSAPLPAAGDAAPTGTPKTKPDVNSKESKALQDCLKKNAPPAPTAAPIQAAGSGATMPDLKKVKAPSGMQAPAPVKTPTTSAKVSDQQKSNTSCVQITKELKIGSKDAEVVVLKKFLAQAGDLKGVQNTDYFGPATEKALKAWQKKKSIKETGITDVTTRTALKNCTAGNTLPKKTGTTKTNP